MEKSYSASYAAAGVDITAGYRSVELMKQYVARTMTENCIGGLGGFGGLFELDCSGMEHPVLISGADHVVDAHGHAVDADGVVLVQDHGDLQLGAHAVGAEMRTGC